MAANCTLLPSPEAQQLAIYIGWLMHRTAGGMVAGVDPSSGDLVVGHGARALAVIDPATRKATRSVALPAHPEGFQLQGDLAWVNLPDVGRIAALSLSGAQPSAAWRNPYRYNFPLAHDEALKTVAVVYRLPARLVLFHDADGQQRQALPTCGDSDDVSFDDRRGRLYVICGAGRIAVFQTAGGRHAHLADVESRHGARTGLFAPHWIACSWPHPRRPSAMGPSWCLHPQTPGARRSPLASLTLSAGEIRTRPPVMFAVP